MYHKRENGCKVEISACGRSGIKIRLEIIKSASDESHNFECDSTSHGTTVTRRLTDPWRNSKRILCKDSCFSSFETAKSVYSVGMRHIGVVKTAARGFMMSTLSLFQMNGTIEWHSKISDRNSGFEFSNSALLRVDCERRYFSATKG